ncbi:MAG TPA: PIG-L family deacetylase, partial [Candidatus Eisenbacteria bacterium]
MTGPLRLMAVLAHPDDESLGMGGTLARCAADGIETYVVTATRGERGRYKEHRDGDGHPGPERLGRLREAELRAAAGVLGVREVDVLGYPDGGLDGVEPREAVARIAALVRRVRPQVVVTFAPDGGYGHPDHIAISQLATAAMVAAADPAHAPGGPAPHAVSKLYYMAWPEPAIAVYQEAFKTLTSTVDGVIREALPWPDWALTTVID